MGPINKMHMSTFTAHQHIMSSFGQLLILTMGEWAYVNTTNGCWNEGQIKHFRFSRNSNIFNHKSNLYDPNPLYGSCLSVCMDGTRPAASLSEGVHVNLPVQVRCFVRERAYELAGPRVVSERHHLQIN